uniref:DNA topoisomerase n=1 Tax=Echinococcus granulosus TaxID=6210 RepID=A0A068X0K2_ECHGR|nr:DNA topoisomerase 3 beta 1 [Echinococcus granulosus]
MLSNHIAVFLIGLLQHKVDSTDLSMHVVLMVAEKPSLAEALAKIMSHGSHTSRRGSSGACSIHEWNGTFRGGPVRFKMTSVCGHVMTLDFVGRFNNWDVVDPVELFSAKIEKKEANPKLKMVNFLQKEAKGASSLILWLDCDKEGENICFEVIEAVTPVMGPQAQIYRAHFTAVTDHEVQVAMKNLRQPNKNEALSVDARQETDLRIGCAFTRFQTKFFQGKYGDLNSRLVSFGPCQTPTLGFCVKRHDRIQSFKPEPFWRLTASVVVNEQGDRLPLTWNRDRLFDKEAATVFLNAVSGADKALVVDVNRKVKVKPRPQGLNTVEMLRVASASLGIGPHAAMAIAERLYTSGFINYPRTESTAYPPSMDLKALLRQHTNHPKWGDVVSDLLKSGYHNPRAGHNAGDHPPIAPMRCTTELSGDAGRLYEYVAQHFIATLMPDCKYETTTVVLSIGEEKFITRASRVLEPGYTRVFTWQAIGRDIDDGDGPDVTLAAALTTPGSSLPLGEKPRLVEGQTSPPGYLTEADLITAMERHGIGTDASIPVHIENIVERAYVEILPGRRLKPTPLGVVLVHGYHSIDAELVLPHMRRAVEEQLNRIATGEADFHRVLQFVLAIFATKYRYFVEHIASMDQLFEVSFSSLAECGRPLTRCGKCRRYLKLVDSKPQRLHCPVCSDTYAVPQNGSIRPYKETKCPLDDFELVLWTQGAKGKSMVFCPYCYINPPFPGQRRNTGCANCLHPTCTFSLAVNGVDACTECSQGTLVLDDAHAPKFRLCCNQCDAIILFSEAVKSASVRQATCEECTARHLSLQIDTSKLKSGDSSIPAKFTGCVFCSDEMCKLLSARKAANPTATASNTTSNGRGGASRGRGSRGSRRGERGGRGRR